MVQREPESRQARAVIGLLRLDSSSTTTGAGRKATTATTACIAAAAVVALEATATAAATTALELTSWDIWGLSWTDAALLNEELLAADLDWGRNSSLVSLSGLEVDECAVLLF